MAWSVVPCQTIFYSDPRLRLAGNAQHEKGFRRQRKEAFGFSGTCVPDRTVGGCPVFDEVWLNVNSDEEC
jgi:hypothetical protein